MLLQLMRGGVGLFVEARAHPELLAGVRPGEEDQPKLAEGDEMLVGSRGAPAEMAGGPTGQVAPG
ncbi:hypothetical protein AB2B41_23720, partial [Marimonas sp. MJW-29]